MRTGFQKFTLTSTALALGLVVSGCGLFSKKQEQRIIVPDDLLRQSDYAPDGVVPRSRYVVRMSDGERDWEIEFPEVATGYELRIPLQGEPKIGQGAIEGPRMTAADREIFREMQAQTARREQARDADDSWGDGRWDERQEPDGRRAASGGDLEDRRATAGTGGQRSERDLNSAQPAQPQVSYLRSVSEIRELFRTRNYEVALVKLVDLERSYPGDEKLLAMKGSLYRQLGRSSLARQAWEEVLRINPHNEAVLAALEELNDESLAGRP